MRSSTRVKGYKSKRVLGFLLFYFCTLVLFYIPAQAAEQARGFGTTLGVATTDRIVSALTANNAQRSWAIWSNLRANTDGIYWSKTDLDTESLRNNAGIGLIFSRQLTANAYEWRYTRPTIGSWVHIVVTYDASTPTTAPIVYFNGVTQTPISTFPTTGTAVTDSNPIVIGNEAAADLGFDGTLSQFAVWNRILTPTEVTNLATTVGIYNGWAPSCYATSLAEYIKLNDQPVTSSVLANPTVTGTVQQTGLTIDYACGAATVIGGRRIIP